jgi:hypothetical protein
MDSAPQGSICWRHAHATAAAPAPAPQGKQRDIVGRLLSRVGALQCAVTTAEATRRQLHNQLVELRGNVSQPSTPTLHAHLAFKTEIFCPALPA